MSRIFLPQGCFTSVDVDDLFRLGSYHWRINDRGYVVCSFVVDGREVTVSLHREIMNARLGRSPNHL